MNSKLSHLSDWPLPRKKRQNCLCSKRGNPYNHIDLPPLVKLLVTWVCIQTGNIKVLLAAVCKSPGHAWNDTDITEFLSFRHKSVLAEDLNAKYPFWNSVVSCPSGTKLLNLLHINEFEISARQCPTHYSPAGNGDVLDIVMHKNVRLSEIIVSDIMESDHLPIVLHLLNHVRTGTFRTRLTISQIGSGFKDWPVN
jgi:hypothetical protein